MKTEGVVQRELRYSMRTDVDQDSVASIRSREEVRKAILKAAEIVTGLEPDVIKGGRRDRRSTNTRHAVIWLMLENMPRMSQSEIARQLGKDHTTILHARLMIEQEYANGGGDRTKLIDGIRQCAHEVLIGKMPAENIPAAMVPAPAPETPAQVLFREQPKPAKFVSRHGRVDEFGAIICNP